MKIINKVIDPVPFTCKIIYVVSFVLYIIGIILRDVPLALANYPERIYNDYEFYRLLVTFLSKGQSVISIIAIVVDFLMIRFFFTKLETKYSTVYFTIGVFLQNLLFQIFFTLIAGVFLYLDLLESFLISYGWTPLIVILVYQYAFKDREEKFKVFCFEVQKKYIPFIIIVTSLVFAFDQFLCILASILFGYLQFGLYGKQFITLSLKTYQKIQSWVPQCIQNRKDFIKLQNSSFKEQCERAVEFQVKETKVQTLAQQKPVETSKQRKTRKTRKVNRIKNTTDNSFDMRDQIESGKSTKDGELNEGSQGEAPNSATNENLNNEVKL